MVCLWAAVGFAQSDATATASSSAASGSSMEGQSQPPALSDKSSSTPALPNAPSAAVAPSTSTTPPSKQQPKRILGIMPNYRAVSAGEIPPPPTAKQALKIATQNSFDYSSFIFVGITSLIAEGSDAHPSLGK